MTRWFTIFLSSLIIVIGIRYATYSPLPEAVFTDCQTPVVENKLQGLWELDRIDNYEAFHSASNNTEGGFLTKFEVFSYPLILERSQLYRIEQCGDEIALTVNYLRTWLIASAEVEKPIIEVELKDFKTELKANLEEAFDEVISDVKEALSIDEKNQLDNTLKFLRKSNTLDISAELNLSGEEIIMYGNLNGKSYKERFYYDAGELVREFAFTDSVLGSTDFIYRRYP
jgi:hypothetical protein